MKFGLAGILLVFVLAGPACRYNPLPSSDPNARANSSPSAPLDLYGFDSISLASNIEAAVTVGQQFSVSADGVDNLADAITARVEGGKLTVGLNERRRGGEPIRLRISLPQLNELILAGTSTAVITGVTGERLRLQANGATKIKASGEIGTLVAHAFGSSSIDAEMLRSIDAEVEVVGASTMTVSTSETLKVSGAGMGTVIYTGDPRVEKTVSSTNIVKRKE